MESVAGSPWCAQAIVLGVGLLPARDAAQALFDAFEQSVAKFGRDSFMVRVKGLFDLV